MKLAIIFLLTWFTTSLSTLEEPAIKVTRVSSNTQIEAAKRQALQRYGLNSEVQVINRNNKGEITDLKYTRYDQTGKESSSCASDNFGLLIITRNGCKIADLGHENEI